MGAVTEKAIDMHSDQIFLNVDVRAWVLKTITKVESGQEWNSAWTQTYGEIGGKSKATGKKGCPMVAARTLYELGRIKGYGEPQSISLSNVLETHSKNGAYAIAAIDFLNANPQIRLSELWENVQDRIRLELGIEPAKSNQGGVTLTYKLWKLEQLNPGG